MLLLLFFNLREERKRVIIKLLELGCQEKKVQGASKEIKYQSPNLPIY